ncbi:MAG: periplasmic heavy metal sensor, partial [Caulobacteraceae bacterium]
GRWWLGGLIVSVALNLFLLGVGATLLWRADTPPQHIPQPLVAAASQLDPQNQQPFLKLLRRESRKIAPDVRAARRARHEAARLVGAQGYDRAGAAAALARARTFEMRARADLEEAVLSFTETLSPRERAVLAGNLKRGFQPKRAELRERRRAN